MHGHQITFFTQQDRLKDQLPVAQWLLASAQHLNIRGATVVGALQGIGHDGTLHATNLFDMGDQPVQVTIVVSDDEEKRLFAYLLREKVQLFYVKTAVEFGMLGKEEQPL